jgi:tight adherence protein B
MNNISFLIRQRLKLLGQIRTLSAEGRLSAWILCLLPFGVLLVLSAMSPAYINQLRDDPSGFTLSMMALGMMLVGVLWMREIVRIRV